MTLKGLYHKPHAHEKQKQKQKNQEEKETSANFSGKKCTKYV